MHTEYCSAVLQGSASCVRSAKNECGSPPVSLGYSLSSNLVFVVLPALFLTVPLLPNVCFPCAPSLCRLFFCHHSLVFSPLLICLCGALKLQSLFPSVCSPSASFFCCVCLSQLECDNFITVIQKVNDTMIVCGTNAGSPRCWMLVRVSHTFYCRGASFHS